MKYLQTLCVFCLLSVMAAAQDYKNPQLAVEKRVQDLLQRMTPEEKFWQLFMIPGEPGSDREKYKNGIFGFQVNTEGQQSAAAGQMLRVGAGNSAYEYALKINEIQRFFINESRLGIPIIPFDEALHGLVRSGATAFPQAIGLAATWNTPLMHKVASAIADECRSRGIRQVLSPVVNIASDVRWGRTEETYGEDPFLAAEMGVAFVSAFERAGIITTPKHYVANVGEGGRDSYPIHMNERLMREIHFPPFEACFRRGGSRSVMTAYNSYNGLPCTAHPWLLNTVLREEWGFQGFVISDAGGTGGANVLHFTAADYPDATVQSLNAGLDVIFQTSYDHQSLFSPPFYDGRISQSVIDTAVARVLRQKFLLGLFENPYVDPATAEKRNGHADHRQLAKKAALESVVLLQNNHMRLPISKATRSIALIGPDASELRLGGYSGPGNAPISILNGIKNLVGENVEILYERACGREAMQYSTIPSASLRSFYNNQWHQGLKGEYFNNVQFWGNPAFVRMDELIDFQWTLFSPDPQLLSYDFWSVRWSGKLKADKTGSFKVGIDGNDGYRLYLDGKLILDNWTKRGRQLTLAEFDFVADREYDLHIEFYEPAGNAWFRLVWSVGHENHDDDSLQRAVSLAAKSDLAIIAVGIEEGEFLDRAYLHLPGRQEELILSVAETGTPVVVLIVGGSAVTMSRWMHHVDAIVQVWYPGEAGGEAVSDVLFGNYNPAGRLPLTFPVFEGQLPLVYNHKPTGRGDDYMNLTGQPLFPFGFGLSYTQFEYTDIALDKAEINTNDSAVVSVTITNSGNVAGDEVVQLYLRDELASVARPVMELKGFRRIPLKPGESQRINFIIDSEMLAMYDRDMNRIVEPGVFRIMIGASSKDIRQRTFLNVLPK